MYKALVKMAFLGLFEAMAWSSGTKFEFETKNIHWECAELINRPEPTKFQEQRFGQNFLFVLFERMAWSPRTKFEFEKANSIRNVLNALTDLNRSTFMYKGFVKMAFLGVFQPMAMVPRDQI